MIFCGLPGSGKTTLATQLAEELGAVRLCPDEWITHLGADHYDQPLRARVESLQWELAQSLLLRGQPVVIEWGVWHRWERDALHRWAREHDVPVELRYLEAPIEVLVQRIQARNEHQPWGTVPITEQDLRQWAQEFEPPTKEELEAYDPPTT